jgi:hypothetical protein
MTDTSTQTRSERNKPLIVQALAALGYTHADITYTGSGDSGDEYVVSAHPGVDHSLKEKMVKVIDAKGTYDKENRKWTTNEEEVEVTLNQALQNFADDLIREHGHSGYENNSGGGGDITIDVVSNSYTYCHYDYVEERLESKYEG